MTDVTEKLLVMLQLQEQMNARVHPDWKAQDYPWHRAIWTESAELMEHFGWKWWKKQTADHEQVVLELIDIWHFGLSLCLQKGRAPEDIARDLAEQLAASEAAADFREAIESFVTSVLLHRAFDAAGFARMMRSADLGFNDLYRSYVGKNVLNIFRQDHGYKQGSYQKTWHGREDNEHLVELMQELDSGSTSFKDALYEALGERYRTL